MESPISRDVRKRSINDSTSVSVHPFIFVSLIPDPDNLMMKITITQACSRCGSPCLLCPDNPQSFPSELSGDEITYINEECAVIDEQIRLLKGKRAIHRRRLNELQSNTRSLPPETLSEIFRHTYRDINDKQPLFQMLSVCSHWYQTACSTPDLWSKLSLKSGNSVTRANLLRFWLSNLGSVPLRLELMNSGGHLSPIMTILSEKDNAKKIRELSFHCPLPSYMSIITQNCVNLEQLELLRPYSRALSLPGGFNTTKINYIINFENQLQLQTLTLREWSHGSFNIPSTLNITTLRLHDGHSVWLYLDLLAQCQHTLTNLYISFQKRHVPTLNHPLVTLYHLRTLHLELSTCLPTFFGSLTLPALKKLRLDIIISHEQAHNAEVDGSKLCKSLPHTHTTLAIVVDANVSRLGLRWLPFFEHLFGNADQIRELGITTERLSDGLSFHHNARVIADLLQLLSTKPLLPYLSRLKIHDRRVVWFQSLMQMLGNRRGFHQHLHLELLNLYGVQKEVLDNFVKQLIEEGCSISTDIQNVEQSLGSPMY